MDEMEREHTRLPLESRVYIELESAPVGNPDQATLLVCTTLDVSARGLQVAVAHELTEGAYLQICVDAGSDDGASFYLVGQVCWCRPGSDPDRPWLAGFALMPAHGSDMAQWEQLIAALPGEDA